MARTLRTFLFFVVALCCSAALAANPSVVAGGTSGQAGATVSIPVSFTAGTTDAAGTQFDLTLPSTNFTVDSVTPGDAANTAQKQVVTGALPNGVRVIIFGVNQTILHSGVLATVVLRIAPGTPSSNYPIGISGVVTSDINGGGIATDSSGSMVTVGSPSPQTFTLGGTVTVNGSALANVRVDASNLGTQFTNASGSYSFGNVAAGTNTTLTPSLSGYTFTPSSTSTGALNANTTINFGAAAVVTQPTTVTLSGRVTQGGAGLSGVDVLLTLNGAGGNSRITLTDGTYSFTGVSKGQTFVITPVLSGSAFSPGSRSGATNADTPNLDFSTFANQVPKFTIRGSVRSGGAGLAGVRINGGALGDRITDNAGTFLYINIPQGTNFVLTPSRSGYVFSPTSSSGTLSTDASVVITGTKSSCTGSNCTTGTFSASGTVTYNGQGLPGASVRIGRSFATTAADGTFTATGLPKGTYYTRPALTGMIFSPTIRRVSISNQNVSGLDFVGKCFSTFKVLVNGSCQYPHFTVSGHVLLNGAGLPGVTVRIATGKAITDASGFYTLPNTRAGLYFPGISLGGYNFKSSLSTRLLTLTSDKTVDFTATCRAGYTVQNGVCARPPRVTTRTTTQSKTTTAQSKKIVTTIKATVTK